MHPARGSTKATETAPNRRASRACVRRTAALGLSAAALAALALAPGALSARSAPTGALLAAPAALGVRHSIAPDAPARTGKDHARRAGVVMFVATPASLPAGGGSVQLTAVVVRASTCRFSATEALAPLPATRRCASGRVSVTLKVPKNTASAARTFHFQLAVSGPRGSTTAGPAVVVEASAAGSAPAVTLAPISQSVTAGASVTFTAAAAGHPAPAVRWQRSTDAGTHWSNIAGAVAASYSHTAALSESGYEYRAVFTARGHSTPTTPATLTVTAPPAATAPSAGQTATLSTPTAVVATAAAAAPQITVAPQSQGVIAGSTVSFTAAATGVPAPTVQWQVSTDGGASWSAATGTSATSTTYSFSATSLQNGWEYEAVFANASGTVTTAAATLTVAPAPVAPQIITDPVNVTVTEGAVARFTATASGVPTPSVQWRISTDGGSTWTNATGATATTYSFVASRSETGELLDAVFANSAGTEVTNAATLTVTPTTSAPVVVQEPVGASVASGATVTLISTASGTPAPSVQWQVSTDGGADWSTAPGLSAESTTYSFVAGTLENGDEYRAVFSNIAGSATSLAVTVDVSPIGPQITEQPTNQVASAGSSATFSAAASGDPYPTVQWQVSMNSGQSWGDLAGAQTAQYTVIGVSASESGYLYRAVFTNEVGSVTTNAASLTVGAATATSYNWAGYAATGTSFTQVAGSWRVPSVSCSGSADLYSAMWIGIDGYNSASVEQDGTDSDCAAGVPSYYAWYEMYPSPTVTLPSGHPVSAGDAMSAAVIFSAPSSWTLTISDLTAGWTYVQPESATGLARSSAEWIAERPTLDGGYSSLADFDTVTFTGAGATSAGASGAISAFPNVAINMISLDPSATVLAAPGPLGGSGGSFSVSWLGSS